MMSSSQRERMGRRIRGAKHAVCPTDEWPLNPLEGPRYPYHSNHADEGNCLYEAPASTSNRSGRDQGQ